MGQCLSFSLFLVLLTIGLSAAPSPKLSPLECVGNPDQKIYLASLRNTTSTGFKRIKNEIGLTKLQSAKDTETSHAYFCRITCQGPSGEDSAFWVSLTDQVSRHNDMQGFQCPHIEIKNVPIVGSIWGPQPVVSKFSAVKSPLPEVRDWLKSLNYQLSENDLKNLMPAFREILSEVGLAYLKSLSTPLIEAGAELLAMSTNSLEAQENVLKVVVRLNEKNWQTKPNFLDPNYFVEVIFITHGRFLMYTPMPTPH